MIPLEKRADVARHIAADLICEMDHRIKSTSDKAVINALERVKMDIRPLRDILKEKEDFYAEATQYHRPNGRQETIKIKLPAGEFKERYESMRKFDCIFEVEILSTGMVACYITYTAAVDEDFENIDIALEPLNFWPAGFMRMLYREGWKRIKRKRKGVNK